MEKDYISKVLRCPNTVFTLKDLSLLWGEVNADYLKKRVYRYVKSGKMYAIRRGLYAKDKKYDRLELATKIYTPAYVSFETVLARAGVVFQYYNQVFIASYLTREITADGGQYALKKIKDVILTNHSGLENKNTYFIASPERAFLDVLYLNKDYHFDNVSTLDWGKVRALLPIYGGNQRMAKAVAKLLTANTQ